MSTRNDDVSARRPEPGPAAFVRGRRVCMLSLQPMLFDARIQKEARALRDCGYAVRIVFVDDLRFLAGVGDVKKAWAAYDATMAGIETVRLLLRSREWRFLPRWINRALQAIELTFRMGRAVLAKPADVYHCHDLPPGVFAMLGKLVHRARLVYDAHELEVSASNQGPRRLLRLYERTLVRASDRVITVNHAIADIMHGDYGRPVAVVENHPPHVRPDELRRSALAEHAALRPGEKCVLYVGYVVPNSRGIEQVVEALRYTPDDVVFLILGVGRLAEFKAHIYPFVDACGVDRARVRFLDPVPPDEIVHLLSGADISAMVIPGVSDSYVSCAPNKLFQSILAGVPILASDNRTLPKYVRDNGVGPIGEVVDENDPKAIGEAINRMLEPERRAMYRENLSRFRGTVGWEVQAERLVELYAGL